MSLFEESPLPRVDKDRPLAERMRPDTLDEYAGQQHILGPGKPSAGAGGAGSAYVHDLVGAAGRRQDDAGPADREAHPG